MDLSELEERLARARSFYRASVRWYMEAYRYHVTATQGESWSTEESELDEDAKLALQEATQGVLDARTLVTSLEEKYKEAKRKQDQGFIIDEDIEDE